MSSSVPRSDKSNNRSDDYDPAYDPEIADADLTAGQYLTRQGERAKAAMMGAAGVIKATAVQKVKSAMPGGNGHDADGPGASACGNGSTSGPMKVIKDHPWYTVGGATAVGFLSALYFNPSRFGRLKGRIKKLEKQLAEQESSAPHKGGDSKAETAVKSSIVSSLGTLVVTQAMNALKPLLSQYVAPMMAGRGGGPDGHGEEEYARYGEPGQMSPEAEAAMRQRYEGGPPPRSAGDASI